MATTTKKYFKFTKVDADSGFSVFSYPSQNQVFPELPGLEVFYGQGEWFYGTADASAKENPLNNILCLTAENMYDELNGQVIAEKQLILSKISKCYTEIVSLINDKYDEEASPIGALRYADAKNYIATGTSSALLDAEVAVSGQDLAALTAQIVSSYDTYLLELAKLSGLKNSLIDRINSFEVNSKNFVQDFSDWYNKTEDLGNKEDKGLLPMGYSKDPSEVTYDMEGNYTVRYYSGNLHVRWRAL